MPAQRRAMRVLYCTDTYPPQVNGVSVVTALSVEGLRNRGWDVAVVAPRYPTRGPDPFGADPPTTLRPAPVGIPSVPMPGYPDLRLAAPAIARMSRVMDRFAPDLVHSATEFMIGRLGQRAGLRRGLTLVSSYHTDFSRYAGSYGMPWLQAPVGRYLAAFHRRSHRVLTPGHPAQADLARLGVTTVEVWGRGVDIVRFHPNKADRALRQAYVSDDGVLFLHVGRLAAEKGVEQVLEGFRQARLRLGTALPMHLIIAGSGPREAALRAMADQHVSFLGNLDRVRVLPRLYASADAFLFASLTETLGLVVLEAMASGLPVVAAPVGGVADHLIEGRNGLGFPPGDVAAMADAIFHLACQHTRRRELGAGARRTAEALSWDRELDRLDASYREVCEQTSCARSTVSPHPSAIGTGS